MKRDGHTNVTFFIGPEVEKTPAYCKRTLFVVGTPSLDEILKQAKDNRVTHVFMGANHSFDIASANTYWDKTITDLLDRGFWVTLDYQAHQHEQVLKLLNVGIWQSRLFVPLLSVRIPKIETSSPNLTIKIDDIDFKETNPGVWCMNFREVTDSNRFTDWQDYESDSVIDAQDSQVATVDNNNPVAITLTVNESFKVSVSSPLNQPELGIDTIPTTALKPDLDTEVSVVSDLVKTPEDAANAYAAGATADPLSADVSKKPKSKK